MYLYLYAVIIRVLFFSVGLLRLQQLYESLDLGPNSLKVDMVKRFQNVSDALNFIHQIERVNR